MGIPEYGQAVAQMLFKWLMQLDLRTTEIHIPSPPDAAKLESQARQRMIENLRSMALSVAANAPNETKAYLTAVAAENDHDKVRAIRPFSRMLASVAPGELAALVETNLIEPQRPGGSRRALMDRALSFNDTDYMPPSPAQPPFLDLLEAAPEVGLALIRKLVDTAVAFHAGGKTTEMNGYTVILDGKPRFFPWVETYFWTRGQAREYSAASGLMALEAWAQERLDKGEDPKAVLYDVVGPEGSCAAYLLIAIDVLMSHWPATRDALVPFIANPGLLANDRTRSAHESLGSLTLQPQEEPAGRVKLADLAKRPSRRMMLERLVPYYLAEDEAGRGLRMLLGKAVEEIGPYDDDADFGDPAFMGAYALNMLDAANWVEVDGGRGYRSPPVEAEHMARLEERQLSLAHSSSIEAKIHLATDDPSKGSAEVAREALDYAAGDLPDDSDTDHLKSRSTRLIATAMLVARDGDDALLGLHESWVREVIARALREKADRYRSSERLPFNRPGMGICALVHLWKRRRVVAERNLLVRAAAREDCAAVPAFASALELLNKSDPRLLRSALRVALACLRLQWHPANEEPTDGDIKDGAKPNHDEGVIAAEITWLDGGVEPAWPALPEERPFVRRRPRLRIAEADIEFEGDAFATRPAKAPTRVDTQGAAQWLGLLNADASTTAHWSERLVDTYAHWTARLNAHGYPADTELDRAPDDWNQQFYALLAKTLLNAGGEARFEALLRPIVELPDQAFCDVADTLIFAADLCYFNGTSCHPGPARELRGRLVERMITVEGWSEETRPGDLRINRDIGSPVAKLLMNYHNPFGGTESYLVPAVSSRVDPLLDTLRPLVASGPTAFVALCTMNTLSVSPRAQHLDFLLFALESWANATTTDPSMWHALGVGRKIAHWFEKAAIDDFSLLRRDHPQRMRIDALLGRLVSLGVPEAHDIEIRIEAEANRAGEGR